MKSIFENWNKQLNEIQYGKAYPMGEGYVISFHSDKETIYVYRKSEGYHPKGRDFTKKWKIVVDEETWKFLKDIMLHGDDLQVAVTRDDLLRGRFGHKRVVPIDQGEEEEPVDNLDDLSMDFEE